MHRLVAEFVTWLPDLRLDRDLAPYSLGPVTRYWRHDASVAVLDWRLDEVGRREVDLPAGAQLLAATPDLVGVVAADPATLTVVAGDRRVGLPIGGADSATWLPGGLLLVTAPAFRPHTWQGRTEDRQAEHRVFLVDPHAGRVLDEKSLDVDDADMVAVAHPHDGSVLLDASEGQDGSHIFHTRAVEGRLRIDRILETVVPAGFNPAGDRLLTTPYPSAKPTAAAVLAWPGLDPIATLDLAGLDSDQDRFDFFGCLLSQDHIILTTIPNHHLLLCTADLHPEAWIDLDLTDGAEPEAVLGLAPDALALELWNTDSTDPPAATVWQIPDLAPPHQRTTMI